ncbi:MAG: homoserine dehydrogenase [Candidatus Eremiobacteraeota bacterium]|nr:homoserine dehydrogenase [Candidatus Eremiobacteraeota bacterium]
MTSSIGIGLIGCGTVGGGVADLLLHERRQLTEQTLARFALRGIAVRSLEKARPRFIPPDLFTRDVHALIDDPENDLIIECVGGLTQAAAFVERALVRGKHVVTANKDLIATQGPRLYALAARAGVSLQYEAAVGGAIPIVRTISQSLATEDLHEVAGVLNGTANFILGHILSGQTFEEALGEAQRLGYAEANPSGDISGMDAAHKLAILCQLAFRRALTTDRIPRRGLEHLKQGDSEFAQSLGYAIKLLAFARTTQAGFTAAVSPVCVPFSHPFAGPIGAQNCIRVLGRNAGSLLFSGAGAGREPTASAVVSDVLIALRAIAFGTGPEQAPRSLHPIENVEPGLPTLGRVVRFTSFRDARPAHAVLEQHGYQTLLLDARPALELFPLVPLHDAEILHILLRAEITPTSILPIWHDASHPHAPVTDTFRTHRREKERIA